MNNEMVKDKEILGLKLVVLAKELLPISVYKCIFEIYTIENLLLKLEYKLSKNIEYEEIIYNLNINAEVPRRVNGL